MLSKPHCAQNTSLRIAGTDLVLLTYFTTSGSLAVVVNGRRSLVFRALVTVPPKGCENAAPRVIVLTAES